MRSAQSVILLLNPRPLDIHAHILDEAVPLDELIWPQSTVENGIRMPLREYHWYRPSWREKKKRRLKKLRRHGRARRVKT